MSTTDSYILDTSAIFAFTDQEEGSSKVEELLYAATANKCRLIACSISLMEVYYVTLMEQGEDKAAELVAIVKSWPLRWVFPDEKTLLQAGKLKAKYRMSVADALIASVAKLEAATLIHKDPEMAVLIGEIQLFSLPFKKTKT